MPAHDIIDNRKEKLVDHINRILSSTESARFAVGYFFLSGLESIAPRLAGVKELRLLIGNTTNRETLEQLAEGYWFDSHPALQTVRVERVCLQGNSAPASRRPRALFAGVGARFCACR